MDQNLIIKSACSELTMWMDYEKKDCKGLPDGPLYIVTLYILNMKILIGAALTK